MIQLLEYSICLRFQSKETACRTSADISVPVCSSANISVELYRPKEKKKKIVDLEKENPNIVSRAFQFKYSIRKRATYWHLFVGEKRK
jgi:hypothetical protein